MPTSLAEAKNNATDDLDVQVIDEFRKESAIIDSLIFDDVVNPAGGGATLTYGYRRLVTQPTAGYRTLNNEYTPSEVTTSKQSVDLAVLGGSFQIDRVISKIGPSLSGAVLLNLQQKIKAARTFFQDQVINGDSDVDADGFDGLNKALKGSTTEFRPDQVTDWTDFDTDQRASFKALDDLDEFLGMLDGAPTMLMGNNKTLSRVRALARRAGMFVVNPVDGLIGQNGRPITRQYYGGILFADPGDKAGASTPIIPISTRDVDSAQYTLQVTGGPTGGTYTLLVGGTATAAIAFNAANSDIKAAVDAVPGMPTVTVTGSGTKTLKFDTDDVVSLALGTNSLTGGTTPSVAIAAVGTNTGSTGLTDLYAVRIGLDGFHGVSTVGGQLVQTWLPDFTKAGAVKLGEVEMGPVAVALKATKAAAVWRNIKVQ